METYNIHEAKTNLSGILARVSMGESFILAKAGKPLAQLSPIQVSPQKKRRVGFLTGHISVPDDFDSMGSEEIASLFEGAV